MRRRTATDATEVNLLMYDFLVLNLPSVIFTVSYVEQKFLNTIPRD